MKTTNKTILYLHIVMVFIFAIALASEVFTYFKTKQFNYLSIFSKLGLLVYAIYMVVEHSKKENNK